MPMIFVISGPSAVGKTTVANALASDDNLNLHIVKSTTTRAPRANGEDAVTYDFVSPGQFDDMEASGDFIETATIYGERYGTSRRLIEEMLASGSNVLKVLDHSGAMNMKRIFGSDAVLILLLPRNIDVLKERMRMRGTLDDADVDDRLAGYSEDSDREGYDYTVYADETEQTISQVKSIVLEHLGSGAPGSCVR